jgi:hypothetical protein
MLVVPTQAVPAQVFTALLNNQQVRITLRQLSTGLFMDLQSNEVEIVGLVICQNLNRIVRDLYLGFQGDFVFLDNTGAGQDPFFSGLGTRFSLMYLSPADLPPGVG